MHLSRFNLDGAATARPREQGGRDDFSLPSSPVKHLMLLGGPKSEVCEMGMGASLSEKGSNFCVSL